MNAKDWYTSESRRRDLIAQAQRHQAAQELQPPDPLRQKLGMWMIQAGQRLLNADDSPEEHHLPTREARRTDVRQAPVRNATH